MAGLGAHIILGREDAKQLFAQKGDAAVRSFVEGLLKSKKHRADRLITECGDAWNLIHRLLSDGTLEPTGGDFPLNNCILGGRRMHAGPEFEAVLIRPDIVPFVAEALHDLKRKDLYEKFGTIDANDFGRPLVEQEFDKAWTSLQHIRQTFEDAGRDRTAILFTVDRLAQ